jgi:tartrate dehydrogenase/decarboxylase/D-malate dehydrogenase
MMLDFLGEREAGEAVLGALETVTAAGEVRTPDMGGTSSTVQMGDAVAEAISAVAE